MESKSKKIETFEAFLKSQNGLDESVVIIDCDSKEDCIDYCMNRIEKEVGSLDPYDILYTATSLADDRVKSRLTLLYVREMVKDYLSSEGIDMIASDDVNADDVPADIVNQAMEKLYDQIADDVLYEICKINGVTDEEVE